MSEGSSSPGARPGMSRRNTYLLGGLTAVAGIAMLIFAIVALTSGNDDSTSSDGGSQERPIATTPSPPPGSTGGGTKRDAKKPTGSNARGAAIHQDLARRRPVRAPDFSAEILQQGSIPQALRGPFDRALNGGKLDLSKLRGTPVVLHLSSSRCAPCRADTRLIETTWKRWSSRGVLFIGASVKEPAGSAKAVLRQYGVTYPAVLDRSGKVAKGYGVAALPQTFFISSGGDIVGEVAGSPIRAPARAGRLSGKVR